ncbi:MAG: protein kinase [Deltaproteobacteria bacterium]|nr:protein kinase [Deltaproteobacteria bacterium]
MTKPEEGRPALSGWGWGDAAPPHAAPDATPAAASGDAGPFAVPEAERYERGGELGRGGMGVVVAALDRRLGRIVARKQVRASEADFSSRRRLAREAAITARLDHPGIVPVFDAGVDAQGEPYYTMRLVAGRTLADAVTEATGLGSRLPLLRRLLAAVEAVAYAHDKGVVHRDLKPANILLGAFGETQVVDWGLARWLDPSDDDALSDHGEGPGDSASDSADAATAGLTRVGAIIGTPGYLSPECARGAPATPQSDVYSLGISLCEILAGRPLHADSTPEQVLAATAAGEAPDLAAVEAVVPAELLAIAKRAAAPLAADRYPDAGALAHDLEAFLDGRVVGAYRYSTWDQVRRLARAWRAPLLVGGVAFGILVVSLSVAFRRTAAERDRAVEAEQSARAAQGRADRDLGRALLEAARTAHASEQLPEAEILAAHALRSHADPEAVGILMRAAVQDVRRVGSPVEVPNDCVVRKLAADGERLLCLRHGSLTLYRVPAGGAVATLWQREMVAEDAQIGARYVSVTRGVDDVILLDLGTGEQLAAINATHGGGLWSTQDRTGQLFRHAADGVVRIDDGHPGRHSEHRTCGGNGSVAFAFAPDAGPLARGIAVVCASGTVERFDAAGLPQAATQVEIDRRHRGAAAAWWSDDGKTIVIGAHDGTVGAYDAVTLAPRFVVQARVGQVRQITGTARHVAIAGEHGGAEVRDLETGVAVARLPAAVGRDLAMRPDGTLLTLGQRLHRWRVEEGGAPLRLPAGERRHGFSSGALDPSGSLIALARADGVILVARTRDGAAEFTAAYGNVVIKFADWDLHGESVVAVAARSATFVRFLRAQGWRAEHLDASTHARRVAILRSGAITVAPYGANLVVHPPSGATPTVLLPSAEDGTAHAFRDLAVSADRRLLVGVDAGGGVWEVEDRAPLALRRVAAVAAAEVATVSPDRARIAVAAPNRVVVLDRQGTVLLERLTGGGRIHDIAWSPDGRWLALGELPGTARLLRADDLTTVAVLRGHQQRVSAVSFDAASRRLATTSWDGSALLWDVETANLRPEALLLRTQERWGIGLDAVLDGSAARALR